MREGDVQKQYFILLNLGLSTVHKNYSKFFGAVVSAEIEVNFCENCIRSSCIRLQWKVEPITVAQREVDCERRRQRFWRSCTSKASSGKCQTWKPIEKRLNRVTFSLKFIAQCQITTVWTWTEDGDYGGKEYSMIEAGESLHGVALSTYRSKPTASKA